MIKISKEIFVQSMQQIQKGLERRKKADDALSEISDGFFTLNIGDEFLNVAIDLLVDVMGDTKDKQVGTMIEWWLFESVEKKVWISPHTKFNPTDKEIEVDCTTLEQLYEYFDKYC